MRWWKHASLAVIVLILNAIQTVTAQTSAPLSTGEWYKIGVTGSGVYQLNNAFLQKLGLDPAAVNPTQIRLFGGAEGMLPQSNALGISTLKELAIQVSGEADGRFDAGDAVLFYAEGPHSIRYDSSNAVLFHELNVYSDTAYYFLNINQVAGSRVVPASTINASDAPVVNAFDDYWFHETEMVNLLKSGREWWGEYLSNLGTWTATVDMPGVMANSTIKMRTSAIGAAQIATRFTWQLNGTVAGESSIGTVSTSTYDVKGLKAERIFTLSAGASPTAAFTPGVSYEKNGQASAQSYLNYISLQTKRAFASYGAQQLYHFISASRDTSTYRFTNQTAGWNLWDISDWQKPASIVENAATGDIAFTLSKGKNLQKIAGFLSAQALEPASWTKIPNQNLANVATPNLVIIAPTAWTSEAARLAAHRNAEGITTSIATTEQVYNEFSSGKPDVTAIRNFVRFLNEKSPGKLRYLLLLGDATYDYKNNLKNQTRQQQASWVPVYESRESLNPVYTYSSDDYFGFLDRNEGIWTENIAGDHILDIGIGRLPVKTLSEARIVVDKLIRYDRISGKPGLWKSKVQFVADDGDGNIHQQHADQLAKLIQDKFLPAKLFIDAFPQNTTDQGAKAPGVNAAILKSINDGTLILNYTGHGGTSGWAEEQILTLADMQAARGIDNLPLLLTATCDFGRYDDPAVVSGAELMVLSPKGAAIGAISTTRPVFSSTNYTLSRAFYQALADNRPATRMGDIFRHTKNEALVGSLNRNFTLLGDPSMQLARAQKTIQWAVVPDTLRALQTVRLDGHILNPSENKPDNAFNGTARLVIYDKENTFTTLGNEGEATEYKQFQSKIFDGLVSVKAGKFTASIPVPKDIDYRYGPGRVAIYAVAGDTLSDASGQLDVILGGSGAMQADKTPPEVTAYLDNETFRDGDQVGPSPVLIVRASDGSGINIARAGAGHNIVLTLNDTISFILNDYFTANLDDARSGAVIFPFDHLSAGRYTARLKVWDIYTNSTEIAFAFQVVEATGIALNDLHVFPNPFDGALSFELTHDRTGEDVEIIFNILLNNGQKIGVFRRQYYNSDTLIREVLDMPSRNLLPPVSLLIYTVEVKSLKDNSVDRKSGKLIRSP